VATLHVSELVLVLNEEASAVLAHGDRHIWHHVFIVAFGQVWTEVIHFLDEDLLKAHAPHHFLVHLDWLVVVRILLIDRFIEQALGEEIVLDALIVVVH